MGVSVEKRDVVAWLCAVTVLLSCGDLARGTTIGQWEFETTNGVPVAVGDSADGQQVDDTGAHASGPLHGTGQGGASLQYSAEVPPTVVGANGRPTTRSLSFDGSNDYVALGNPSPSLLTDLPQGPFTIQTWLKTTDNNRATILGGYDGTIERTVNFEVRASGEIRAYVRDSVSLLDMPGNRAVNDGQWHHVAMVYAGTGVANNVKLYVGGQLDKQGTYGGTSFSLDGNVVLGRDLRTSGIPWFDGLMDLTLISDVALAPASFLMVGNGEQNCYRMETTGGVAVVAGQSAGVMDDTGLHPFTYDGVAASPQTYSSDVDGAMVIRDGVHIANSHSLSFNGTSDYVELGNKLLLKTLPEGDFTIEFFVKTPRIDARQIVVGTYDGTSSYIVSIEVGGLTHGANQGHARVFLQSGGGYDQIWGTTDISDNRWHHVAVVRSGAGTGSDQVRLYVDYVSDGQVNLGTGQFTLRPNFFRLGRDGRTFYYTGLLDELRITRKALAVGDFLVQYTPPGGTLLIIR